MSIACSVADRMAFAAEMEGSIAEHKFWKGLPQSLQILKQSIPEWFANRAQGPAMYTDADSGISVYRRKEDDQRWASTPCSTDSQMRLLVHV